jgi:hypothetical protein
VPGTPSNADWAKPDLGGLYDDCGYSVASAGDLNGDGYADVAVGCPGGGGGEVQVYYGSATGLPAAGASWTAHKEESGAQFGYAVASAGDVNRDGYSDLIAGTYWGWAYVFHGSGSGLDQFGHRPSGGHSQAADWTATAANICFGCTVASAGDVNGDGYADVVIGAPYYTNVNTNQGMALVYHGSATGLDKNGTRPVGYTSNADWSRVESTDFDAEYGISAATAGDVNGDGYADLVVGAIHTKTAYVYHGSAAGLATAPSWTFTEGGSASSLFGNSVATAGDVNGDGYADVIVGDWWFNTNGRASVFFGNDGGGRVMRPRQRRYDDTAQIAPLGKSEYGYGFGLRMIGRTPFGRSRVKLEYEVKPLRTLFDGAGTERSPSWSDTGTGGVTLVNTVNGVTQGTVFHWRARVRYDAARSPLQPWGRWITVPWNGWQEADLRTPCAVGLPTGVPPVTVSKSGVTATVTWNTWGTTTAVDVVAGTLGTLRSTGGDFSLAVNRCLAADTPLFSVDDATVPALGDGFFYLVRQQNCAGVGSYDDESASQQGDRDTEIYECP